MPTRTGRGRQKRVRDEAAAWHARMMEPTSDAEVAAFEEWLEAAPTHAQAYDEIQSLSSLGAKLPRQLLDESPASSRWAFQPAFGFAAAILIMFVAGLWLDAPGAQPAYAAVSNPGPSIRTVRLVDGTEIILDARTELAVAFEDDARQVRLSAGRARFIVASDETRPFSVSTPSATVTARGTIFDVTLSGDAASIFVVEGVVDVSAAESGTRIAATAVRPGEAVEVRGSRLSSTSVPHSEARWPVSRLAFDNASLASIVRMANREGDPDIALQDSEVGKLEITGVLDIRDTRTLARKLAATHDLRIDETAGSIVITR